VDVCLAGGLARRSIVSGRSMREDASGDARVASTLLRVDLEATFRRPQAAGAKRRNTVSAGECGESRVLTVGEPVWMFDEEKLALEREIEQTISKAAPKARPEGSGESRTEDRRKIAIMVQSRTLVGLVLRSTLVALFLLDVAKIEASFHAGRVTQHQATSSRSVQTTVHSDRPQVSARHRAMGAALVSGAHLARAAWAPEASRASEPQRPSRKRRHPAADSLKDEQARRAATIGQPEVPERARPVGDELGKEELEFGVEQQQQQQSELQQQQSEQSQPVDEHTSEIKWTLTCVYLVIFFIGVVGNVCNCLVIADSRNKYMKTATNYYLFSLSVSDLLLLIFGLPHDLVNLWHPAPYLFNQFVCISRGWISEASTYASVLVIVAFTVERYLAICHPLKAHTLSRLSRSIKIIVTIWLVASTCALVVVMQFGIQTVLIDENQLVDERQFLEATSPELHSQPSQQQQQQQEALQLQSQTQKEQQAQQISGPPSALALQVGGPTNESAPKWTSSLLDSESSGLSGELFAHYAGQNVSSSSLVASELGRGAARKKVVRVQKPVAQCTTVALNETIFELSVLIFFIVPMTVISILYMRLGYHLRKKSNSIKENRKRRETSIRREREQHFLLEGQARKLAKSESGSLWPATTMSQASEVSQHEPLVAPNAATPKLELDLAQGAHCHASCGSAAPREEEEVQSSSGAPSGSGSCSTQSSVRLAGGWCCSLGARPHPPSRHMNQANGAAQAQRQQQQQQQQQQQRPNGQPSGRAGQKMHKEKEKGKRQAACGLLLEAQAEPRGQKGADEEDEEEPKCGGAASLSNCACFPGLKSSLSRLGPARASLAASKLAHDSLGPVHLGAHSVGPPEGGKKCGLAEEEEEEEELEEEEEGKGAEKKGPMVGGETEIELERARQSNRLTDDCVRPHGVGAACLVGLSKQQAKGKGKRQEGEKQTTTIANQQQMKQPANLDKRKQGESIKDAGHIIALDQPGAPPPASQLGKAADNCNYSNGGKLNGSQSNGGKLSGGGKLDGGQPNCSQRAGNGGPPRSDGAAESLLNFNINSNNISNNNHHCANDKRPQQSGALTNRLKASQCSQSCQGPKCPQSCQGPKCSHGIHKSSQCDSEGDHCDSTPAERRAAAAKKARSAQPVRAATEPNELASECELGGGALDWELANFRPDSEPRGAGQLLERRPQLEGPPSNLAPPKRGPNYGRPASASSPGGSGSGCSLGVGVVGSVERVGAGLREGRMESSSSWAQMSEEPSSSVELGAQLGPQRKGNCLYGRGGRPLSASCALDERRPREQHQEHQQQQQQLHRHQAQDWQRKHTRKLLLLHDQQQQQQQHSPKVALTSTVSASNMKSVIKMLGE